jgi:16S rRNA (adenine1518-N6/adenine1519-N6)-dimethyltransferase
LTTHSLSTLLKKYKLQPRKGLGQNFLADPLHLKKIVTTAELSSTDTVLEIGPGPGTLTRLLVESAGQVIAVELDPHMVNLLKNELGHFPNLTIIEADILQTPLDTLFPTQPLISNSYPERGREVQSANTHHNLKSKIQTPKSYKVVANLPYYITSAVIRHLLEATAQPERLVVTVQHEVARRIVAKPGQMSVLSVSVQFYGQPALVHRIPAGAFYPPPKVESAVVRIDTYPQPPLTVTDVAHFFRVVKAGFSQKRKQLKNSLAAGLGKSTSEIVGAMEQVNINPTRRAETLSLEEWRRLVEIMENG